MFSVNITIMNKYLSFFLWAFLFSFGAFAELSPAEKLLRLEAERLKIENQKTQIYSQINVTKNNIKSLSEGLEARKGKLAQRLQSSRLIKNYKWGALLELKKLNLLQRNLKTLKALNEYDLNFIREQIYKLDELKAEKEILIKSSATFENLSQKLKQQEDLINKQESEENQRLAQSSTPSLLLLKGQLARPVPAEIVQPYGLLKLQEELSNNSIQAQYIMYNKGIVFKSNLNTPVQAIGPGKVIFRDVLNHWGESIILEHDGEYYSVYANVKNCSVQIEQRVQMSEKLCDSTSADFYFELRHSKITINPKNWIKDL